MTDDDRLLRVLRSAFPPVGDEAPSRDLWPSVADRIEAPDRWVWLDLSLAALVTIVLVIFPEYVSVLAYHL